MNEEDMFFQAGFHRYSTTEGELSVNMMGMEQKVPYVSENFINSRGTIGYSKVSVSGMDSFMFISRTKDGDILTLPGNKSGPLELDVIGAKTIWGIDATLSVEMCYHEHLKAIGYDEVTVDEEHLKLEVPKLPQRNFDAAMKVADAMFESMGGMDGMMDMMKDAMEGMAEAFSKGMQEAMDGQDDGMEVIDLDKEEGEEETSEETEGEEKEKGSPG